MSGRRTPSLARQRPALSVARQRLALTVARQRPALSVARQRLALTVARQRPTLTVTRQRPALPVAVVGRRSPLLVSGRHSSVERDRGGPGVKLLPGVLRVRDEEPETHDGAEHAAGYGCLPVSTRACPSAHSRAGTPRLACCTDSHCNPYRCLGPQAGDLGSHSPSLRKV